MKTALHLRPLIPFKRIAIHLVLLALCFCWIVAPASADTTVGGFITTDTIWTLSGSPYIVTSNIYVRGTDGADGVTSLTIEAGAEIRMNKYRQINIGVTTGSPGALIAQGTADNPVVFTSNEASPSAGDWKHIRFYNTSDDTISILENCSINYAGYGGSGAVYIDNAAPTINAATISNSGNYDLYYGGTVGGTVSNCTLNSGIYLMTANTVDFTGNTFNQNNAYPIKTYADNIDSLMNGNTFANLDAGSHIYVNGGNVTKDATWTAGIPIYLQNTIHIRGTDGADGITTLTLLPGAQLRFNRNISMSVGASSGNPGALIAQGTAGNPIVFTSNEATPAAGDWDFIRFYSTSDDATSILENCSVNYAGHGGYGSVYIYDAAPTITATTVNDSSSYDLYYRGTVGGTVSNCTLNSGIYLMTASTVDFTGNTFNQNNAYPIKTYADNVGALVTDNTFANLDTGSWVEVIGNGSITKDATWTANIPYRMFVGLTVKGTDGADGITALTIEAGAVLKFNSGLNLKVGANTGDPGALIAHGTAENPILVTSSKATPAAGDWIGIRFNNTADDNTSAMRYCIVEYAGIGAVYLDSATPSEISHCNLRYNSYSGLSLNASHPEITCNTFGSNDYGIYASGNSQPVIRQNNFNGNTSYGLYNASTPMIIAEDNWWGDQAGPDTGGDQIYGNVDADPWSTAENDCTTAAENHPPNTPSNPIPADEAVRVVIASETITLQWAGGDPDLQDTVTYDLKWGSSPEALATAAQDIAENQYTKTGLAQGITYYWQITAKDTAGLETSGPVWRFTTDGDPPDLMFNQITTDPPGNLQPGQSVTLIAEIMNNGSGPAVDPFATDFLVDGVSIGTAGIDQILMAGETIQVSQTWTYSSGNPAIELIADHQAQVEETIETNNTFNAALFAIADNAAPLLVGSSPADEAVVNQVPQITASLDDSQSALDDVAVIASFSVVDSSQQTIAGTVTETDGVFVFVPASLPMPDDGYQVTLTAKDIHGNSQNYAFNFTIDTQPPAKPVITGETVTSGTIQPRPVENTTNQFTVKLIGTREAGTSLWVNGELAVDVGDADWSVQVDLEPGANAFELWLKDKADNQGQSEWVDIEAIAATESIYEYDDAGRVIKIHSNQQ